MEKYKDKSLNIEERIDDLLSKMNKRRKGPVKCCKSATTR